MSLYNYKASYTIYFIVMNVKDDLELTKSEEQVMQALWSIGKGFANEIVAAVEEPKPAYNTILTVVRLLERKGFVGHETYNKSNLYYPLISRDDYSSRILGHLANRFFGSSFRNIVSFLVDKKAVSLEELDALIKEVEK